MTLWQHTPTGETSTVEPHEVTAVLSAVHEELSGYREPLPRFDIELADARRLLQVTRTPTLAATDRRFLLDVVDELEATLPRRVGELRPLHGSPHSGNWIHTREGLKLLDFETACLGPREWDLAALDDTPLALFDDVDLDLVPLLRRMRSVCVAAKCWVEPNRAPAVQTAAHVHLQLLRGEPLD